MPDTEVVIIFYDWDLVKSVTMMRNSSCFDRSRLHDTMEQGLRPPNRQAVADPRHGVWLAALSRRGLHVVQCFHFLYMTDPGYVGYG